MAFLEDTVIVFVSQVNNDFPRHPKCHFADVNNFNLNLLIAYSFLAVILLRWHSVFREATVQEL